MKPMLVEMQFRLGSRQDFLIVWLTTRYTAASILLNDISQRAILSSSAFAKYKETTSNTRNPKVRVTRGLQSIHGERSGEDQVCTFLPIVSCCCWKLMPSLIAARQLLRDVRYVIQALFLIMSVVFEEHCVFSPLLYQQICLFFLRLFKSSPNTAFGKS